MGKATKWFRNLLGMKRENSNSSDNREKKKWSFGKSLRNSVCVGQIPAVTNPVDAPENGTTWLKSYYTETESEQNKHAIAVAAATAAAADAAVAAAQAAVAVVRLTSHGRGTMFGGGRERWAAVKIQSVFRGFLAKKALRALKGLVKLQALVRGYLVRKQATATLHSMQALIRAQLTVRSQKAVHLLNKEQRLYPEFRSRRSTEKFDDSRSEHTASIHSRRLSASLESAITNTFEESPKIVEIDTCRPKSRSRRITNSSISDYYIEEDPSSQMPLSSSLPCQIRARMSVPDSRNCQDYDWGVMGDECRFSTAQTTPRFMNTCGSNAPTTPAKSVCTERLFQHYSNSPNYMANTQSFKAKVRSYSAPKQRPEPGSRKKLSLNEFVESRASLSGVRMQKSCSQAQETITLKNAVMGRLDRSAEFVREMERNGYYERKW